MGVKLTGDVIESFAGMFLSPRYDDIRPTAQFHREAWALYCSDVPAAMVIAPRDHAKSTALTFDYILSEALFRRSDYIILIGATEEASQEQMSNISDELHTNDDLIREFHVKGFPTDTKTDLVCELADGHQFRILGRGAEQKIRGRLWKGKRPNLMICDDMEDDEQVENADRRKKFRKWFFRAAKQALSKQGRIRVHGTILHEDSLLNRLRKNSTWKHLFYKAHTSFDDFSDILWPERWTETELRAKRQEFIDDNDAAGYSQEILNDPFDNSEAFIRRADMLPMEERDHEKPKLFYVGCDFAVSTRDKANKTSFTIGGKCVENFIHIVDQRTGRWDALTWIDEMFTIQARWNPETFFVEDGVIWKAVKSTIEREMRVRNVWLNFTAILPVSDKAVRARPYQKRSRSGSMKYDKEADWYTVYETIILKFTGRGDAVSDDELDSTAILVKGCETYTEVEAEDFYDEDEWSFLRNDPKIDLGRNPVTGY